MASKYDEMKENQSARKSIKLCWLNVWNIELCQLFLSGRKFFILFSCKPSNLVVFCTSFVSFCLCIQKATKTLCVQLVVGHIYQALSNDWSSFSFLSLIYHSTPMLNLIVFEPMLCVTSNKVTIRREKNSIYLFRMCARVCVFNAHFGWG